MAKFFDIVTMMENYEEIEPVQISRLEKDLKYVKETFKLFKARPKNREKCASGGSDDPDNAISCSTQYDKI